MKKLIISLMCLLFTLHVFSQNAEQMVKKGQVAYKKGQYQTALKAFTSAVSFNKTKTDRYLQQLGKYDTLSLKEQKKLFPDFTIRHDLAVPYYKQGLAYVKLKKNGAAMKDFSKAIKIDTGYASAYYQRALLFKSQSNTDMACADMSIAAKHGNKKAKDFYANNFCWSKGITYYRKGKTQFDLGVYKKAIHYLSLAIAIDPDSAGFYCKRGEAYAKMGMNKKAQKNYAQAISLDSLNPTYHYYRGLLYYKLKKYNNAFNDFTQTISASPRNVKAYLHRAYTCEKMDKESSAIYDYSQVISIKPDDDVAYYKRGLAKKKLGEDACPDFIKAEALGNLDASSYADICKNPPKKKKRKHRRR